jgi:hypothetical protein
MSFITSSKSMLVCGLIATPAFIPLLLLLEVFYVDECKLHNVHLEFVPNAANVLM